MRSFVIFILLVGALAFVVTTNHNHNRRRHLESTVWVENIPPIENRAPRPAVSRAAVVKPTVKKTKRVSNNEPAFTFSVTGTSDTEEAAKKDAIYQAARFISGSLELQQAKPDESQLEKMVIETCDKSEGFLGNTDDKDLGAGKQVLMTFELPNEYIVKLTQLERGFRMDDRMGWLARGLAVIVAGLFAISGYMRLDEWSKGYFSGALKAIAVVAVIGTGAAVYFLR